MEIIAIILSGAGVVLLCVLIALHKRARASVISQSDIEKITSAQAQEISKLGGFITSANETSSKHFIEMLELTLKNYEKTTQDRLNAIDSTIEKSLFAMRNDNNERLDNINNVVQEKLQKSIDEKLKASFDNVIMQIGNVNKAIGEIRSIASDVSSLKNVLANVKAKGITGEVLLGGIISEILAPEQYDTNVATKKNSKDVVEFAIKIPTNDGFIYLPVDSKFPLTPYNNLRKAIESGDKGEIESAKKELRAQVRNDAKAIYTKYIDVPYTTDFAIMFLPTESLYIEAIEMGLFEVCQGEFKVILCGPSTVCAIINALKLGFNSVEIQKRSNEVFMLLGTIKTEFDKFAKALSSTQAKFSQLEKELDELVGKRTRIMQKKLENVASLEGNADFVLE